jgi:hypothetical protein
MSRRRVCVAVALVSVASEMVAPAAPATAQLRDVHGSDAKPVLCANEHEHAPDAIGRSPAMQVLECRDGHVNSRATIARLRALHADTHMFAVHNRRDWNDLRRDFAPAAQAAGIKVWVNLLPPSGCAKDDPNCAKYSPFKKRYDRWARAIARLSTRYPVVTGWAIDDFANADNRSLLTPKYLKDIREQTRSIQPALEFYPVVYSTFLTDSFVRRYAPVIDAVIMPYRDDPYRNTLFTGSLTRQLDDAVTTLAEHDRKLILMVYALNLKNTQIAPDVDYVRRITTIGMQYMRAGRIAGVVQYGLPLTPGRPGRGDRNYSHDSGNGALMLTVRAEQRTSAQDSAGAHGALRLHPGATSCRLRLWHRDNRGRRSGKTGYHVKRVRVNGFVKWARDVFEDDTGWHSTALTLSPQEFADHGAAGLTLELYEQRGVSDLHVRTSFDDVTLTGCYVTGPSEPSFETIGGWQYSRSGGPVLAGQHIYDPEYSTTVFDLVAQMYAR